MSTINRTELSSKPMEKDFDSNQDPIFKKYANKTLPTGLMKTTAGINPYNGAWTEAEVLHLLRRCTFSPNATMVQTLLAMNPSQAVDLLFTNAINTITASVAVTNSSGTQNFNQHLQKITYDHIPNTHYLTQDFVKVVDANIRVKGSRVGYIAGSGDLTEEALVQL
ncbi:MAG: hypothetical protein ACO27Q_11180, partial [Bacteroidia bacterium]